MPQLHLVSRPRIAPSDDEIKALARTDRKRAVSLVVHKYRTRLYSHALYILKNAEGAYDVVQEVFIKAIREHRFFNEDFKMKAWLFRVTSNLCFNIVRNKKRRGALLEQNPQKEVTVADQDTLLFKSERQEAILAAMDKLSEDHSRILMLRYYSDLSYAEIADTLDVKLGTVMSRLSRAKSKLVEVLDDPSVTEA